MRETPGYYDDEGAVRYNEPAVRTDDRIALVQRLVELDVQLMEAERQIEKLTSWHKQLKDEERTVRAELRERLGFQELSQDSMISMSIIKNPQNGVVQEIS